MFVVAVLHVISAVLLYALLSGDRDVEPNLPETLLVVNFVLAAIYASLGFWARANPLPAAIVGLVLFISVMVLNAVLDPTTIAQGVIVKVIVIVVLSKAIQAGAKHRKMVSEKTL